ncbi:hypothetical protein F4778DRAFT_769361 [Xylariomycetidae sp. FL2044]|nr:hypothetical protein F4778DRAFT_769361 [Xylariomycetidae sp. FL2044]
MNNVGLQRLRATPSHSRPLPNPSPKNDPAYKTALKGASLAFQKTGPKSIPNPTPSKASKASNGTPANGALIAATSASRDHGFSSSPHQARLSRISRQTTGNSIQETSAGNGVESEAVSQRLAQFLPTTQTQLLAPNKPATTDSRSPSFIAATLAASRSASPGPQHSQPMPSDAMAQQVARRMRKNSADSQSMINSSTSLDQPTDTASIPPTNALISMFEKGHGMEPAKKAKAGHPAGKQFDVKPKLRAITPPRAVSPVTKHDTTSSRVAVLPAWESNSSPVSTKNAVREKPERPLNPNSVSKKRPPTPPPARGRHEAALPPQPEEVVSKPRSRAATPPPKSITLADTVILSPQPRRASSGKFLSNELGGSYSANLGRKAPDVKPKPRPKPELQRPLSTGEPLESNSLTNGNHRKYSPVQQPRPSSSSSHDTFISASSAPSPGVESLRRDISRPLTPETRKPLRPASSQSARTNATPVRGRPPALMQRQTTSSSSSNLPLDSLTSAIVAGSLASARATPGPASATKIAPPPPPPRQPTPHMRTTLRQPQARSELDEDPRSSSRHRKKHLVGSRKKHSHHEGARRRWREEMTARERKRYEGVWASNRGLLLVDKPYTNPGAPKLGPDDRLEELVANVVVRDIWSRSRLPFDELSEVWDLVDSRSVGVLDKAEFVVGMWLIDQRLRGRKIPRKVGDSVWGSAKGVRVLGPGKDKGKGRRKGGK